MVLSCGCVFYISERAANIPQSPAEAHRQHPAHCRSGGHLPLQPQALDPLQTGGLPRNVSERLIEKKNSSQIVQTFRRANRGHSFVELFALQLFILSLSIYLSSSLSISLACALSRSLSLSHILSLCSLSLSHYLLIQWAYTQNVVYMGHTHDMLPKHLNSTLHS